VISRSFSVGRPMVRKLMWYVYFLELANADIYVGSTNDLKRRIESHQNGYVQSTRAHCPVTLKAYVAVRTEGHARALELYVKSGSGKAFAKKRFLRDVAQALRASGGSPYPKDPFSNFANPAKSSDIGPTSGPSTIATRIVYCSVG